MKRTPITELFIKIKGIKNIKIIIGLIILAIMLICFGNYKKNITNRQSANDSDTTANSYIEYTPEEKKLADVLSQIDGIGKTTVMIAKDSDNEISGIIIVAEGADKPLAEMKLKHAVVKTLHIDYNNIEVYSMNQKQ